MTDIYVTQNRFGGGIIYLGRSLDDAKAWADTYDRENHYYTTPVEWDEEWVPRNKDDAANLVETLYSINYAIERYEVAP